MVNEEPICPDPSDKESGIYKAKQIGEKKDGLTLDNTTTRQIPALMNDGRGRRYGNRRKAR